MGGVADQKRNCRVGLLFPFHKVRHLMSCLTSRNIASPFPTPSGRRGLSAYRCRPLPRILRFSEPSSYFSSLDPQFYSYKSGRATFDLSQAASSTAEEMLSDTSKPREMAQIPHSGKAPQKSAIWPRDEILRSLLAAASKQHTPIAPSPLNPTLCESDIILGRHIYQLRKTRPIARRPPEISPTLRFLKRKAYFEYQAHEAHRNAHKIAQQYSLQRKETDAVAELDVDKISADMTDCADGEDMPATFIVESGPLIQIVQFEYPRHGVTFDIEKQRESHRTLSRWQSPRHRLQFYLILFLMSACLTLLTVFSLAVLKTDRYLPG